MTPSMRRPTRRAARVILASGCRSRARAPARRARGGAGHGECLARRRARRASRATSRRSSSRSARAAIRRVESHRSRSRSEDGLVTSEPHQRRRPGAPDASLAARSALTRVRGAGRTDADRARTGHAHRLGQGGRSRRRPRAETATDEGRRRARRRASARGRDAGRVPSQGRQGNDGRLPVLRARPETLERRIGDLGTHRDGRVEDRPPRDPFPDLCGAGRRGREARCCGARAGLVVLRGNRDQHGRKQRLRPGVSQRLELDRRVGSRR